MRDKIKDIVSEIERIAPYEEPRKKKEPEICSLADGLDELIEEWCKGSRVAEYLKTFDAETIKVVRLLWQVGKEESFDPEFDFEKYPEDEGKVKRLKEIFIHLVKDEKDVDIDVIDEERISQRIRSGYNVVFR